MGPFNHLVTRVQIKVENVLYAEQKRGKQCRICQTFLNNHVIIWSVALPFFFSYQTGNNTGIITLSKKIKTCLKEVIHYFIIANTKKYSMIYFKIIYCT